LGKALEGMPLPLCGYRQVVTGGRLTRRPEKGHSSAERRQKNFREVNEKNTEKKKKIPNNSTIKPLQEGGERERHKDRK